MNRLKALEQQLSALLSEPDSQERIETLGEILTSTYQHICSMAAVALEADNQISDDDITQTFALIHLLDRFQTFHNHMKADIPEMYDRYVEWWGWFETTREYLAKSKPGSRVPGLEHDRRSV